ncbi:ATP-grasp domain-containing protein [Jatrophihabitans sp.]|uniref:ATP-grasp domain-containing protein n=1 Tax=Jatrophihabitans sp. TaxID=1932789 RepID=UPI002C7AA66C|nr:ATP-grasp domain-containing protein [Jatrophihabitans sp.]
MLVVGGWTEGLAAALGTADAVSFIGSVEASDSFDTALLSQCFQVRQSRVDDATAVVLAAHEIAASLPVTRVVCQTERGLIPAAIAAQSLRIPGPELLPVMLTMYKPALRKRLTGSAAERYSLPYASIQSPADLREFAERVGLPLIVKPTDGAGAVGVRQIRTQAELDEVLSGDFTAEPRLAEELVDGPDIYSVETQSVDGRHVVVGFSYSRLTRYPYAVFNCTFVPPPAAKLGAEEMKLAADMAQQVLDAIGLRNGSAHTEFKLRGDGTPVLIESQLRVGGDRIWRMVDDALGVRQLAADSHGQIPQLPAVPPACQAFYSFVPPSGELAQVRGLEALASDPAVLSVDVLPGLLERGVPDIVDNLQRPVQVLVTAGNAEALAEALSRVTTAIEFCYADGRCWRAPAPDFA